MLMDNLGYGDVQCYGNRCHRTPHIDRLAREGLRFTDYYSTSGVCTPSRASLMTGCYPRRVNLHVGGRGHAVLMPVDPKGLHPGEITLARLLRGKGYATACVGKWHLGDQPPFLPTRHGFDRFFGCPYSEDMVPTSWAPDRPPLPLMRNETVIEAPMDRSTLTRRYTEESIDFVRENRDRPFLLYLAHAMPGSTDRPFSSLPYQGKSANGPYGDAVEELDWSCGEIMRALRELNLDERTLIVWTSDNGAVRWNPPQGSNAPLKGWGYDTSEGGQRVPCIARWPGRIPAGVESGEVVTMMDWFPTLAALTGAEPPRDRTTDGHDIRPILFRQSGAASAYDEAGFFLLSSAPVAGRAVGAVETVSTPRKQDREPGRRAPEDGGRTLRSPRGHRRNPRGGGEASRRCPALDGVGRAGEDRIGRSRSGGREPAFGGLGGAADGTSVGNGRWRSSRQDNMISCPVCWSLDEHSTEHSPDHDPRFRTAFRLLRPSHAPYPRHRRFGRGRCAADQPFLRFADLLRQPRRAVDRPLSPE
jgi:arylsulfatase A-like enzyme